MKDIAVDINTYAASLKIIERVSTLKRLCEQVIQDNRILPEENQIDSIPMKDIAVIMGWEYEN